MSSHAGASRSPRLVLRFAIYSAIALLLAGAGILWFARHAAESRSEREVLERAQTTSMLLADRFQRSDFEGPVDATRRAELDHIFSHVIGGEVVRVKLWSKERDDHVLERPGADRLPSIQAGSSRACWPGTRSPRSAA